MSHPIGELVGQATGQIPRMLLGLLVGGVLAGVSLTLLILYGFPALWHFVKPIIHNLTQ